MAFCGKVTKREVIRECRALPVVAHPFLNMTRDELRVFLPEAKAHGLMGMEAYYTTYDRETTECAGAFAAEFGLLTSGGSDYHGSAKPHTALGTGYGDLRIPMAVFKTLRATAEAL